MPQTYLMYPTIAGMYFALKESNAAGKIIVVLLLLGSVFVWSLMISKWKELSAAEKATKKFLNAYRNEAHPVALYLKRSKYKPSPLFTVYERTCLALGSALESRGADPDDLFMGAVGGTEGGRLEELHVGAVRNVAERNVADEALMLETNMGFLATSTTTAPFLGLLGTVWGVMESFAGMANSAGGAMISAVAPGISGALLTTVIGLVVALPSAIGYNLLSDKIRTMTVKVDNFSQELVSDMERHYRQ